MTMGDPQAFMGLFPAARIPCERIPHMQQPPSYVVYAKALPWKNNPPLDSDVTKNRGQRQRTRVHSQYFSPNRTFCALQRLCAGVCIVGSDLARDCFGAAEPSPHFRFHFFLSQPLKARNTGEALG